MVRHLSKSSILENWLISVGSRALAMARSDSTRSHLLPLYPLLLSISYLDIPLVLAAFVLWKFFKKTRFVNLTDIPLREALDEIERKPEEPEPRPKGWLRWVSFLWD